MVVYEIVLLLFGACALSLALPTSLLEDIKDAQIQSPARANKVKRAQEFIMFGNQQNGAANNMGNNRNEKRATEIDDNSLSDDEVPLPHVVPQIDEQSFDTNQLGTGKEYDRAFPHLSRDLYYNLLLRNLELTQQLHNDPAYALDVPMYGGVMDSRTKRSAKKDAKPKKTNSKQNKSSTRSKRDHGVYSPVNPDEVGSMSAEDIIALLRLLKMESENRKYESNFRNRQNWPAYENEVDEYQENDDYNFPSPQDLAQDGGWRSVAWPRPHKRFMVSKRQDNDLALPFLPYRPDYSDEMLRPVML